MIIDTHFHMMAQSDEPGCFMSAQLQSKAASWVAHMLLGTLDNFIADLLFPNRKHIGPKPITSALIRDRLLQEINEAHEIDGAVLLAMDRIFLSNGQQAESHLVVANEYVAKVIKEYQQTDGRKQLYLGASVHPFRPDALEQLEQVKELGAVLIKWIPSSLQIDLKHPKVHDFYKKLAELQIPLLSHAGWEEAIPVSEPFWHEMENPSLLIPALEQGVTVIVAHCAAPYFDEEYERWNYVPVLEDMFEKAAVHGWNLYADISALLLSPVRAKALRNFLKMADWSRFIYGSDFPVPTHDLTFGQYHREVRLTTYLKALAERNLLDKDVLFKRALDFPEEVFSNTAKVLGLLPVNGSQKENENRL